MAAGGAPVAASTTARPMSSSASGRRSAARPPPRSREADAAPPPGGRLLVVHDYGRDDVSHLHGDATRIRRLEPAERAVPQRRLQDAGRALLLDVRLDGRLPASSSTTAFADAGRTRGGRAEAAAAVVQRRGLPPQRSASRRAPTGRDAGAAAPAEFAGSAGLSRMSRRRRPSSRGLPNDPRARSAAPAPGVRPGAPARSTDLARCRDARDRPRRLGRLRPVHDHRPRCLADPAAGLGRRGPWDRVLRAGRLCGPVDMARRHPTGGTAGHGDWRSAVASRRSSGRAASPAAIILFMLSRRPAGPIA